jgi:hypothetical protein
MKRESFFVEIDGQLYFKVENNFSASSQIEVVEKMTLDFRKKAIDFVFKEGYDAS